MRFRDGDSFIEAEQFLATGDSWNKIMALGDIDWKPGSMGADEFFIMTKTGHDTVCKGDWVVKNQLGEFLCVKGKVFPFLKLILIEEKPETVYSDNIPRYDHGLSKRLFDRHDFHFENEPSESFVKPLSFEDRMKEVKLSEESMYRELNRIDLSLRAKDEL